MRAKNRKNFNYLLKGNGRHRKNPTMKLLDKIDKVVEQDKMKNQVVNSELVYIDSQAKDTPINNLKEALKDVSITTTQQDTPVKILKSKEEANEEIEKASIEELQVNLEEKKIEDMTNEEKLIFAAMEGVEILELLSEMQEKHQKIKNILENSSDFISSIYSEFDKEINDIYHAIELYNFNASEGYKFSKMLQDTLQRRRAIKSAQSVNTLVKKIFKENSTLSGISHNAMQGYEDLNKPRTYTPRKLTDLNDYTEKNKKTILSHLQK